MWTLVIITYLSGAPQQISRPGLTEKQCYEQLKEERSKGNQGYCYPE